MKKNIFICIMIISLTACTSLGSLVSGLRFADGESGTEQDRRTEDSSESGDRESQEPSTEEETAAAFDLSAFLTPELQFSLYYASYYFLGGYGFGDDNFRDGEGVRWSVSSNRENNEILITRAKLKTLADGSAWWYFSTEADGSEYYYEMLVENDYDLLRVRYKNSSSGAYEEFVPEGDPDSEDESIETLSREMYNQYKVGSESVKTRAGSFKSDHIVFNEPESELTYEYWVSETAPGHIVKYRYENRAENQIMTGEIIDIRGGYKTRLESF